MLTPRLALASAAVVALAAPIYAFITGLTDNGPQFLRAQANVVDVVPDAAAGYRDMWDVHFVAVPPSYAPDSLRDLPALLAEAAAALTELRSGAETAHMLNPSPSLPQDDPC